MKKIIYRKFLLDCLIFFGITLISTSIIIWVFQAVNYLDLIIDDGRNYSVYLQYTFLNLPKIISKIFPFAFFFSFSYVIAKYELNNELLIYWNFGVNKIQFINYFFLISLIFLLVQTILTSLLVPKSQNLARTILRNSDFNFVDNFIKMKKFNASVNDLTIYAESKDNNENYNNIYIKKKIDENNFQIIFAKKGIFTNNNDYPVLELFDGENTSVLNEKITNFGFSKSSFNLSKFSSDTILVKKTQEHKTIELIECIFNLKNKTNLEAILKKVRNCEIKNINNIISELYKRLVIPLYLPALMLTVLLLIIHSKEKVNYSNLRIFVFLIGFFTIIFSESTLKFVNSSYSNIIFTFLIPIIFSLILYVYLILKLKKNI